MDDYDNLFFEAIHNSIPILIFVDNQNIVRELTQALNTTFTSYRNRNTDSASFLDSIQKIDSMIDNFNQNEQSNVKQTINIYFQHTKSTRELIKQLACDLSELKPILYGIQKKFASLEPELTEDEPKVPIVNIHSNQTITNNIVSDEQTKIYKPPTATMVKRLGHILPLFDLKNYITLKEAENHVPTVTGEVKPENVKAMLDDLVDKYGLLTQQGKGSDAKYYLRRNAVYAPDTNIIQNVQKIHKKRKSEAPNKAAERAYIEHYINDNSITTLQNQDVQVLLEEKYYGLYTLNSQRHVHATRILGDLVKKGYFTAEGGTKNTVYIRTNKPIIFD